VKVGTASIGVTVSRGVGVGVRVGVLVGAFVAVGLGIGVSVGAEPGMKSKAEQACSISIIISRMGLRICTSYVRDCPHYNLLCYLPIHMIIVKL